MLSELDQNAKTLIDDLTASLPVTLRSDIDAILAKGSPELRTWWLEQEITRLAIAGAETQVQGFLQQGADRVRTFATVVAEHAAQVKTEIDRLETDLPARFAADDSMQRVADLRANAEKRLRNATLLREAYLKEWKGLMGVLALRKTITDSLTSVQNEIANIRSRHNRSVEAP